MGKQRAGARSKAAHEGGSGRGRNSRNAVPKKAPAHPTETANEPSINVTPPSTVVNVILKAEEAFFQSATQDGLGEVSQLIISS